MHGETVKRRCLVKDTIHVQTSTSLQFFHQTNNFLCG